MAVFRRGGSFGDLMRKLQAIADRGGPELYQLLDQVVSHDQAQPRKLAWMLTAGQSAVRERGRQVIGQAGEAVDLLVQAMVGTHPDVQRELARDVVKLDRAMVKRAVSRLATGRRADQLRAFVEIVKADSDWKSWLVPLKRLLDHDDVSLRQEAVDLLGRDLQDDAVRLPLQPLLHDEHDGVREAVITAFCDVPKVDVVEPFFARLGKEKPALRDKMVRALGRLARDPEAHLEEHLGPVLADEDAEVRDLAVNVLSHLPDRTATLRAALLHVRGLAPWLRERATRTLLSKADLLVEPAIALMGDPDADVRAAAMALAGEVQDAQVVPSLQRIFTEEGDWWVRSMAADLLTRFPSDDLVDLLLSQFDNEELQFAVISAVAKLDSNKAREQMLEFLRDGRGSVVSAALRGMLGWTRGLVTPDVMDRVCAIVRDDQRPWLRARAADLLRTWGEEGERKTRAIEAKRRPDDPMAEAEIQLTMKDQTDEEPARSPAGGPNRPSRRPGPGAAPPRRSPSLPPRGRRDGG